MKTDFTEELLPLDDLNSICALNYLNSPNNHIEADNIDTNFIDFSFINCSYLNSAEFSKKNDCDFSFSLLYAATSIAYPIYQKLLFLSFK